MRESTREKTRIGGIISEVVANCTDTSDFLESSFADEISMFFQRKILVKHDQTAAQKAEQEPCL